MRDVNKISYQVDNGMTIFTKSDGSTIKNSSIKNPEVIKQIAILAEQLSTYERSLVDDIIF